uniref:Uncharacterized protein n=1 Tax=viral metagenome TaxID=1070528 RepID=A0A6C0KGT3_9ZZZZ
MNKKAHLPPKLLVGSTKVASCFSSPCQRSAAFFCKGL